tara:strand:- start:1054 stop:2142 length:1089 start_codon:yes stop_codon:yes gene_type:complete
MSNGDNVTTQISREAPFLEDYRRRLMDSVFAATDQPIVPQGRTIADFDPFQQAGFAEAARQLGFTFDPATGGVTRTGQATFQPFLDQALAGMQTGQQTAAQAVPTAQLGVGTALQGIPALQAAQGQFDPSQSNYQQFFDQYQADVTNQALKQMDEEAAKAQANLATQAQRAGAFGGSRFGVQEAELAKNLQDIKSRRITEDLSRNFQQAQAKAMDTFERAQARNLGVGQALGQAGQGLGQAAQGFLNVGTGQAQLGQGIAGLGQLGFGLGQQGVGTLGTIGGQRQARQQALSDEDLRLTTARQQEPLARLRFVQDQLSRVPSAQQRTIEQPIPFTNPLLGAIGAGISGLGTFGSIFGNQGSS